MPEMLHMDTIQHAWHSLGSLSLAAADSLSIQAISTHVADAADAAVAAIQVHPDPNMPEPDAALMEAAAGSLGRDIFVFLVASVVVVPLCKTLEVSPVLGFLLMGCVLGPYGLSVFTNNEADLQLGDFGILFLLFNEGLSLSPERIKDLSRFTGLGVFQLLLSIALIFGGTLWGGPYILHLVQMLNIPLDDTLIQPLLSNKVTAFCIASAGALSSSAFVLPVLKQKKWTDRPEGIAGLSILLLQDLAVAPLLVLLPLLAGSGPQTSGELGILVAKATFGFGTVLVAGSYILRFVFDIVAAARSTETFVAAALLVCVGMGQAADLLGLSASTGAFAAGVLLAGNRYRAQIQADIQPFEGILLGIFFLTAGANLDPQIVIEQWPTLLVGIAAFLAAKTGIIFASGPSLGLTPGQAIRVALTLAGGGEFALVLFQLAQQLGVLPLDVAKLLIASVIISMSLTPLLGELATVAGNWVDNKLGIPLAEGVNGDIQPLTAVEAAELFDAIDTDDSGTIDLEELREALLKLNFSYAGIAEVFENFDENHDGVISRLEWKKGLEAGLLSDTIDADSEISLRKTDTTFKDDAIVICGYGEVGKSIIEMTNMAGPNSGIRRGDVVAFDLNPSRVTAGVLQGAPVVFGDAAKMQLLKAAGISNPRAVIITYASDKRRIDTTMRLRQSLPPGTPIYVFEGNSRIAGELFEAGATDVISEITESVLRFGSLVGISKTKAETEWLRRIAMDEEQAIEMEPTNGVTEWENVKGLTEDTLTDLAEELECTRRDLVELNTFYNSIADNREVVPISELKEMLMRQAGSGPSDGKALERCMEMEDEDGIGELTFVEFARATWAECVCESDDTPI